MSNLIIITGSFPYEGGEQFLESEIRFWNNTNFNSINVIPRSDSGKRRDVPSNIKVLLRKNHKGKLNYLIKALVNPIFYKEIKYIFNNKPKNILYCLKIALKDTALILKDFSELKDILKNFPDNEITLYTYWNDISSYAACLLKRQGLVKKVVSRAHGFDLYQERRLANYMPLKRQFTHDYDVIFLLSKSSLDYYQRTYNTNEKNLNVARLGVDIPSTVIDVNPKSNTLRILSLSYCVPVKQIDLIMSAVASYSNQNPKKSIVWTHIGDGPLFDSLSIEAKSLTNIYSNLKINFTGNLKNSEVKKNLETMKYDVIINASKSEGIPVSLMEAMSFGIPVIAPNVGGISDLVNDSNGFLMPSICTIEDIIKGIDYIYNASNNLNQNAYLWVTEHFNSSINYPNFIAELEYISGLHENQ